LNSAHVLSHTSADRVGGTRAYGKRRVVSTIMYGEVIKGWMGIRNPSLALDCTRVEEEI
jgi:hypothetical protein